MSEMTKGVHERTAELRAFHGEPQLKAKLIQTMGEHREQDLLVQGQYWADRIGDGVMRGCAVGCLLKDGNGESHARYEVEFGIPEELAWLEERVFEKLPQPEAVVWPEQFLDAIPVGADLAGIADRFDSCDLYGEDPTGKARAFRGRLLTLLRQAPVPEQRTLAGQPFPTQHQPESVHQDNPREREGSHA